VAKARKNVPRPIKQALLREAGNKCANPGCTNYRAHLHHIMEWAVYETNDQEHMIAICPTCHDAVHYGSLEIADETLYRWKRIKRKPTKRDHLYVEPSEVGSTPKLLLGSIAVTGPTGVVVFELSPTNRLGFRLVDQEIFMTNLSITTLAGREVLRVVDNHVKHTVEHPVRYDRRPGRIRVTTPVDPDFLQPWALDLVRKHEPQYANDGNLPLLDAEVIEPGLVRVQGIWPDRDHPVVITRECLMFIPGQHMREPLSMIGEGADSVLLWHGPITKALFGFNT
jgi:hypothetical protein